MAITEVHRAKVIAWLVGAGGVKENDIDRSRADTNLVNVILDNMTLLNDEPLLDTALLPIESARDTARVDELEADIAKAQLEIDSIEGRP